MIDYNLIIIISLFYVVIKFISKYFKQYCVVTSIDIKSKNVKKNKKNCQWNLLQIPATGYKISIMPILFFWFFVWAG